MIAGTPRQPLPGVTGIVLAGGRSSRMGRSKALLPFGGQPLVLHVLATLGGLFDEVIVVAAAGQDLPAVPARIVYDDVPDQGPMRGILDGLRAASHRAAYVTSCDAAFPCTALIAYLVSLMPHHDIVVPRWAGRDEPLHAVYRTATARPVFDKLLRAGQLRPVFAFDRLRTRRVGDDEIRRFDPAGASFHNINTPEDYTVALRRLEVTPVAAVVGAEARARWNLEARSRR